MKPGAGRIREQLRVRGAREQDAPDVARIYVDSWNAGFADLMPHRRVTAEVLERWRQALAMSPPHRWWVAELRGSGIGFVGIRPSRDPVEPGLGELDTIAIDPGYWRLGIGRTLMSLALLHLGAEGYREAVLWTLAGYERGQCFYEATGWSPDGGVRDSGRQIRYRRALSA